MRLRSVSLLPVACRPLRAPQRPGWRGCSRNRSRRVAVVAATAAAAERRALFISPVWPEPSSSAAGVRTAGLIQALQADAWTVSYLSPSRPNQHTAALEQQGCTAHHCQPNRTLAFEAALVAARPTVCIFDRFLAEEAFSFHVRRAAPDALRVVDLQDLHFLRRGREALFREGQSLEAVLAHRPGPTQDTLRELAAIHRSDLALVCSPVELQLLQDTYQLPAAKLELAPFFVSGAGTQPLAGFAAREHFMTIGNFRHPPNLDSVAWLAEELWAGIRAAVGPQAQLHIYGAHGDAAAVRRLHRPEAGLHLKGHAPSLALMARYRACLAPLRFGAGLKGKVVDSWAHGTPVATTPIGAEGMHGAGGGEWGGLWQATSAAQFVADAARLYTERALWERCQAAGTRLLRELYDGRSRLQAVLARVEAGLCGRQAARQADFVGSMLWQQQFRATEYFSRWIELKEAGRG